MPSSLRSNEAFIPHRSGKRVACQNGIAGNLIVTLHVGMACLLITSRQPKTHGANPMQRRKPSRLAALSGAATAQVWATVAFFGSHPLGQRRDGCTLQVEALGTDYAEAKRRCDELLNPQFVAWRKGEEDSSFFQSISYNRHFRLDGCNLQVIAALSKVSCRKTSKSLRRSPPTCQSTQTERWPESFGILHASQASHRVLLIDCYDKLKDRPDGRKAGPYCCALRVTVCKRAWNVARRDKPLLVPWKNPFDKMELVL